MYVIILDQDDSNNSTTRPHNLTTQYNHPDGLHKVTQQFGRSWCLNSTYRPTNFVHNDEHEEVGNPGQTQQPHDNAHGPQQWQPTWAPTDPI